jgi:hypothetical protein
MVSARSRRADSTDSSSQAATAGYRVDSAGTLPLLHYVLATRPED